jgi:AcrR family transcriptional regulator
VKAVRKNEITRIVAKTRVHRDAFAIQELAAILQKELDLDPRGPEHVYEVVIEFVDEVCQALATSPIYSDTLVREFYRNVLDIAEVRGVSRHALMEDLLFQSLRRPQPGEPAKRRKQKDARDRILQAALSEFSEKGFHNTTIDTIAERAGIAKGTVYRYFKTKETLFAALKEDTITGFVDLAKKDMGREEDVLKLIESIIKNYLEFFASNSPFFKVLLQEQKDFGREFSEKFIHELILALPGLKRRCWKASRDGSLKQMNYFTVFYGIIGFLNGVIQKWLHEGGEGSLTDEIDIIKEVLFYGFAVPSSRAESTNTLKVVS